MYKIALEEIFLKVYSLKIWKKNRFFQNSRLEYPLNRNTNYRNVLYKIFYLIPGSKMITKRRPNGVQKKTWTSFLVVQKATFCITYVRFYGNFLLSEWHLTGNVFRLSKCQRIVIVYRLPIR